MGQGQVAASGGANGQSKGADAKPACGAAPGREGRCVEGGLEEGVEVVAGRRWQKSPGWADGSDPGCVLIQEQAFWPE